MTKPLLGCIADDFTGATDLANNLVRGGMRVVQTIGVPDAKLETPADAIVVALKSRTIAAADAVAQSLAAQRWLRAQGVEQLYFKYCSTFDSTDRGNIGPVIDALLDAMHGEPGAAFTIACPAFPAAGRTIYKGYLYAGDVLLSESGMQHHPLTPMTDPNLVRVLQRQTKRKVGLVAHDVVASGSSAVRERFTALQASGVQIAIVDAISNDDLMTIGRAVARMPLVTAGSGIAIGLPQNWHASGGLLAASNADRLPKHGGLRAIVSCSCSTATNRQVLHFKALQRPAYAIDPLAIARGDDVVAKALVWCAERIGHGPLLVHATAEPRVVAAVQAQLGAAHAGELVERTLAAIARGLIERGVRQLVVAGGETSGAVVQALGVKQMLIGPQIEPGVPWTAARSPLCAGQPLHIALKSGNFGSEDFFGKAFARLDSTTR
jgi:3-dehydrotetronate 4-kinase